MRLDFRDFSDHHSRVGKDSSTLIILLLICAVAHTNTHKNAQMWAHEHTDWKKLLFFFYSGAFFFLFFFFMCNWALLPVSSTSETRFLSWRHKFGVSIWESLIYSLISLILCCRSQLPLPTMKELRALRSLLCVPSPGMTLPQQGFAGCVWKAVIERRRAKTAE